MEMLSARSSTRSSRLAYSRYLAHRQPRHGRPPTVPSIGPQPVGGRPLASGLYLYRLVTDEGVLTRKLILLRLA